MKRLSIDRLLRRLLLSAKGFFLFADRSSNRYLTSIRRWSFFCTCPIRLNLFICVGSPVTRFTDFGFPWMEEETDKNESPFSTTRHKLKIYLLPILYNINIIWPTHTHALDSNVWSKQTLSSTDRGLQSKTNMHTYIHGEYVIQYLRTHSHMHVCIRTYMYLHYG